jgi:O-antigen ligase
MTTIAFLSVPALIIWAILIWRYAKPQKFISAENFPIFIIGALIAGCVFGHDFYHRAFGPIPITIDRIVWGLMLGMLGVLIWTRKTTLARLNHIDIFVVSLVVLIAVSTFANDWRYRDNLPMGRMLFFNLMPLGFYFAARNFDFSPRDLKRMFVMLSALGVYLSLTGIAEVNGWTGFVWPRYISSPSEYEFLGRARGPLMNPVANGLIIVFALCGTLSLWPVTKKLGRVLIVATSIILTVGVVATLTRSIWACLPIVFFGLAWVPATIRIKGAMLTVATVAAGILVLTVGDNFNSFQRDKHVTRDQMAESATLRPMLATVAWEMFQDRPVLGCGFGQYTKVKRTYHLQSPGGMPLQRVLPYMQHNIVLSYLTELGLVGVSLFLLLIGFAVGAAWQIRRAATDPLVSNAGMLILVMVACWLFNGMLHDVSIMPMVGSFMFFLFGLTNRLQQQLYPAPANANVLAKLQHWRNYGSKKTTTVATG